MSATRSFWRLGCKTESLRRKVHKTVACFLLLRVGAGEGKICLVSIVVIEDERDVLRLLCDVLESDGFEVIGVGRPDQVQRVAQTAHPDVFLLDLMLPGMSGIELARRLRELGYLQEPMIAMSASPRMLNAAHRSGLFQETLAKPFDLSTLLDTVERYAS